MPPRFSISHASNLRDRHAQVLRESRTGQVGGPDQIYFFAREFCAVVLLTAESALTSLAHHVLHVVGERPEKQVIGIDATADVAGVAHYKPLRNRAFGKLERGAMCKLFRPPAQAPISTIRQLTEPDMAAAFRDGDTKFLQPLAQRRALSALSAPIGASVCVVAVLTAAIASCGLRGRWLVEVATFGADTFHDQSVPLLDHERRAPAGCQEPCVPAGARVFRALGDEESAHEGEG